MPRGIWWGVVGLLLFFVVGSRFFLCHAAASIGCSPSQAGLFRAGIADWRMGTRRARPRNFLRFPRARTRWGRFRNGRIPVPGRRRRVAAFMDATKQFDGAFQEIARSRATFNLVSGPAPDLISHLTKICAPRSRRSTPIAVSFLPFCHRSAIY